MIINERPDGIEISWRAGGTRVVPPLTLEEAKLVFPEVEKYERRLKAMNVDGPVPININLPVAIICAVMRTRYPEITPEDIRQNIDDKWIPELWRVFWANSLLAFGVQQGPPN